MPATVPRIGVPFLYPSSHPDAVDAGGGEPVPLRLPLACPKGGVALAREWISDVTEVACAGEELDALLLVADDPETLTGMLNAALRLDLPAVCVPRSGTALPAAMAALGMSPLFGEEANVAVEIGRRGGPRPGELVEDFSLANALRAGVASGCGPEMLVHLSAIACEANVMGFSRMMRVLAHETPAYEGSAAAIFTALGDSLHDVPTVAGRLKESLTEAKPAPEVGSRFVFVRGRASGTEAVCRVPAEVREVAGECRVFGSEAEAMEAVRAGEIEPSSLVVVNGQGSRGAPGVRRLDGLGGAIREADVPEVVVLTDGLAPEDAPGIWLSLFTPEAAAGGIIGRLRDGDTLRIDFEEGRIRTGIKATELARRGPFDRREHGDAGYVARYARSALPALEGAGFG